MNNSTSHYIEQLLIDSGLLSINSTTTNLPIIKQGFSNDTILITGAAGTIGSELSKQILLGRYKKLILVDIADSPLYNLIKDFEFEDTSKINFMLLDITDQIALKQLFEVYKPTLVFHAAAYKHVPLLENNPYKAVTNNILATKILADLSETHKVKKFIFISTDKAVSPISIMGMTKQIAENYLNSIARHGSTSFLIARFGNILGSNGSLLPILKKQIESGFPLTITSKDMTRYFITKHKACHLILTLSATFNDKNGVFTFNMGEPIKIIDLARKLASIYSKENEDYKIKIIGLRSGEKLHENLISKDEKLIPTKHKDIFLVKSNSTPKNNISDINALKAISPYMSHSDIKVLLKQYLH